MHDIIISNMIQSERDRLKIGNNRPEEIRPIQINLREFLRRFVDRREERAPQERSGGRGSGYADHSDCACRPVR